MVPSANQKLLISAFQKIAIREHRPVVVEADENFGAVSSRDEEAMPDRGKDRIVRERNQQHRRRQQQQPGVHRIPPRMRFRLAGATGDMMRLIRHG